jgi:hypothetical protein
MYRQNNQHQQMPLFSSLDDLPNKQRHRLETSWAATFYEDYFCRIDEDILAVLYSDKASRPNIPVNVLVSLEALKAGFGWSDAELETQMAFNIQVRYALGYRDLSVGHFELRTVYNFRRRLAQHMQQTGENLLEAIFEQVTDKQIEALELKTGKLRMDSTQIASNIRQMSRLQLLVEVVQRAWRILSEADRQRYEAQFEAYLKGTSGQYVYHIKPGEGQSHLEAVGHLMQHLVRELADDYTDETAYQVLARVYSEHFVEIESELRPKAGKELSAQSLQSPDDLEATYRHKRGQGYQGYVTNISETCDPDNGLQLIVKVQTESNSVDDAVMLDEAVPHLVARTDVEEVYTDGGFNSADVDKTLKAAQIEQFQTAIRGHKGDDEGLGVADFVFTQDDDGHPQDVTCPHGQQVEVKPGRKAHRFNALFDQTICEMCPLRTKCPTKALRRKPGRILRFSQRQVNVAHRYQNQQKAKASGQNLRSAVEATVRSVKHPFRQGKLPVRGKQRVSMMMIASAAMTNVRRIWRYNIAKTAGEIAQIAEKERRTATISAVFELFVRALFRPFAAQSRFRLLAA